MKKILIILLILIVIPGSFIGYKWYTHYKLSSEFLVYSSIDSPEARAKLTKLELNTAFKPYSTETVNFGDVIFQIPKESSDLKIEKKENSIKIETNGKTILFQNQSDQFINQINEGYFIIGGEKVLLSEEVVQLLLNEKIDTEYELLKFVYNQNPNNINYFSSNKTLKIQYELLALKIASLLTGGDKYLANFEDNSIKCFQACKPELDGCKNTLVQLFTNDENTSIILIFKGFNQEEINYVLKSTSANSA